MRYMVRTVSWLPERAENVAQLRAQIPQLEIETDYVRDGYGSFFAACKCLNNTGGVLMEDDVALCRNFAQRAETAVSTVGYDHLVSFFERPKIELPAGWVAGSQFLWMQCIYMPPGFPQKCVDYYEEFRDKYPDRHSGMATDLLIAYALIKEKRRYWRVRPCLVQHLPLESAIGSRPKNRQTKFFIDDMETLE